MAGEPTVFGIQPDFANSIRQILNHAGRFNQWGAAEASKSGQSLGDPTVQANVDTATLYQTSLMKFLHTIPGGDDVVVAASAQLLADLNNPAAGAGQVAQDLQGVVGMSTVVLGAPATAVVFQIEFGAMGFALLGAPGLQPFGDYGKNVGAACGALSGPAQAGFVAAVATSLGSFHT